MSRFFNFGLGQTTSDYLSIIAQYESGNQNIPNYKFGTLTPQGLPQTAQGYYQITNQNWLKIAPQLGIDTVQYPNAMSAPADLQTQVATYLLTSTPLGVGNWANFNPLLNQALTNAGLQTTGPVISAPVDMAAAAPAPTNSGAVLDVSGAAAATPTSSLMDQLNQQASTLGVDLSNPTTDVILAAVGLAALFMFGRLL